MDDVTRALKSMYEEFPYPPTAKAEQRIGWDVNLLLSYGRAKPPSRPLTVLDAGCGRGAGVLGAAALQPHVRFVGADINGVALAEATAQAKARGLTNVTFREIDLTTLDGLEVPKGGFDAIFSSGVVHHMPDPSAGLARLASILAPHGMLQLMVYGRRGREPLYRMVRAMDRLLPRQFPLRDRLMVTRQLASSLVSDAVSCGPWSDLKTIGDVELVDRYLNVNENSYDIPDVFDLLEAATLRFVRWTEPDDWDLAGVVKSGPLLELAARLSDRERYALVDELAWRPKLEMIVCGAENEPRPPTPRADLMKTTLCVSPEVSFQTEVRNVHGGQRVEQLSIRVRQGRPIAFDNGVAASALLFLKDTTAPFKASELVHLLGKNGVPRDDALDLVSELVRVEVLYAPH